MNVLMLMIVANVIGPGFRGNPSSVEPAAQLPIQAVAMTGSPRTASAATGRGAKIVGVGIGYPPPGKRGPQARLLAWRAAEVGAVADLSRQLNLSPSDRLRVHYLSHRVRSDGSVEVVATRRTW